MLLSIQRRLPSAVHPPRRLAAVSWVVLLLLPLAARAAPPSWWASREVTIFGAPADDYAAINEGQLKNIATQAEAELDANLPGGAGAAVHALVDTWSTPTAATSDYSAVNLGMLKTVAQPFYDQLIAAGYANAYPWTGSKTPPNDFAAANIGQAKNLFSFDVTYDSDGDGLPDWWERHYFGHLGLNPNTLAASGDGLTLLQSYQQGINPNDFYNGHAPTLAKISGDQQTGSPGGFVPKALLVSVTDGNGNSLPNAPVSFSVSQGGGQVQASSSGSPNASITVLTDASGQAKAYFQLPNVASNTSQIVVTPVAQSGSASPVFTESSDAGLGSGGGGGNPAPSPFAPTNVVANLNLDGSVDVSWTNNADPTDQTPIAIQYSDLNRNVVTAATVPAGTTAYTIPADASPTGGSGGWPAVIDYITPPAQGYATVDLSGDSTDGNPVSLLALDDNNNAAFAYYTDLANGPPTVPDDPSQFATGNCVVKLWQNGTLSAGQTFSLSTDSSLTYPFVPIDGYTTTSVDATHFFVPSFLTSTGTVFGSAGWWVPTGNMDASGVGLPFESVNGTPQALAGAPPTYFTAHGAAQGNRGLSLVLRAVLSASPRTALMPASVAMTRISSRMVISGLVSGRGIMSGLLVAPPSTATTTMTVPCLIVITWSSKPSSRP